MPTACLPMYVRASLRGEEVWTCVQDSGWGSAWGRRIDGHNWKHHLAATSLAGGKKEI